jgi:ATP:corrinoid adenosyltransferase
MIFIEVKSLAGMNYIRAADVLAVQYNDPQRCTVILTGGVMVPCSEAAKELTARLEAVMTETETASKDKS